MDKWYSDNTNFWNARSIFRDDGLLDIPHDRGGFKEGKIPEDRMKFIKDVIKSKALKDWLKTQDERSSEVYAVDNDNMHFRATNNRSYGYTYLWAWQDE